MSLVEGPQRLPLPPASRTERTSRIPAAPGCPLLPFQGTLPRNLNAPLNFVDLAPKNVGFFSNRLGEETKSDREGILTRCADSSWARGSESECDA